MNDDYILTILVPTYNRENFLIKNLLIYHKILDVYRNIKLVIIDNNSDYLLTIPPLLKAANNFLLIRNESNIGGTNNIIKCLQYSSSPWIWVIPDDCAPNISNIENLLITLSTTLSPIVMVLDHSDCIAELEAVHLTSNKSHFLNNLSWLPSTIYRSDLIGKYISDAKLLACYSYPHLVVSCQFIKNLQQNIKIPLLSNIFLHSEESDKRYSWIHGALYKFSKTIISVFGHKSGKRILRNYSENIKLNTLILKTILSEFSIVPLRTSLNILSFYGLAFTPFIILHLFLKFIPLIFIITSLNFLYKMPLLSNNLSKKIFNLKNNIIISSKIDIDF